MFLFDMLVDRVAIIQGYAVGVSCYIGPLFIKQSFFAVTQRTQVKKKILGIEVGREGQFA